MSALQLLWLLMCSSVVFGKQGMNSTGGLLYEKRGNISLAGVVGRFGDDCGGEVERGLEEVISAIWTVEALNTYRYLPGVTIGLSLYDACETSDDLTAKLVDELSEEESNIGILTSPDISKKIPENSPVAHIKHILSEDMLTDITVQLLVNLHWMNVSVLVVDSKSGMNSFRGKASEEGIFIQDGMLSNCSSCDEIDNLSEKANAVAVMIASFADIASLTRKFSNDNIKLILTPSDFIFDFNAIELPKDTIVCLPSMQEKRVLSAQLISMQRHRDFFTRKPPIKGPLFLGTAATVLSVLKSVRTALEKCPKEPCASAPDFIPRIKANKIGLLSHEMTEISPDDVEEALKVLKIEPSSNDEMFLYIASVINGNASEDFAIFQIFNLETKTFQPVPIMINDHLLSTDPAASLLQESLRPPTERSSLEKGCYPHCQIPEENLTATANRTGDIPQVSWRYVTWVSVNTSVGFVGVTCTLSIMLFIVIKICKEDFLEGSPYFTLLLMVSVILTYLSSFPFHMEFLDGGFMCAYRKCVPPVVFAVLFSLLLSRSIMVAFSEASGGLSGHINGYLQSILCVFMIGVQVSIISQNWLLAGIHDSNCADAYDKYNVLLTLIYDFLLLILLACVSPFIVRSKRNCKEGLLFSISVFFITIVWSAWISFYVLLPTEHKDAAVAVGLNSTASVLLLCIFIPQMYFMAAPFSHNQTVRALCSLDSHILPGGSHTDFKSSHALNDCSFGNYRNCELGCTNPSYIPSRPNGTNDPGTTENFVGEREMTPEAPQAN